MNVKAIICFAVVLALTRMFGQGAPVNDDFAGRTVLAGSSITITGTLAGAT